jgi:AraC-like DNA-binding protein
VDTLQAFENSMNTRLKIPSPPPLSDEHGLSGARLAAGRPRLVTSNPAAARSPQPSSRSTTERLSEDRSATSVRPLSASWLLQYACAEMADFAPTLAELGARALLRDATADTTSPIAGTEARTEFAAVDSLTLRAPVHGPEGEVLAYVEIVPMDIQLPESWHAALRAIARRIAGALSERSFRYRYREAWVVAAQSCDKPDTTIVVATDGGDQIIGANRNARELLRSAGQQLLSPLPFSQIFDAPEPPSSARPGSDAPTQLCSVHDGAAWCALITPPSIISSSAPQRPVGPEEVADHTRPRLELVSYLMRREPSRPVKGALPLRMLRRMREYIDRNLNEPISLDDMAHVVGISTSHFSRSFRKAVGLTPHDYIVRRRVARAQQLLLNTELRLADIALQAGFSDQSHFTRRFREHLGMPPQVYRLHYRS